MSKDNEKPTPAAEAEKKSPAPASAGHQVNTSEAYTAPRTPAEQANVDREPAATEKGDNGIRTISNTPGSPAVPGTPVVRPAPFTREIADTGNPHVDARVNVVTGERLGDAAPGKPAAEQKIGEAASSK